MSNITLTCKDRNFSISEYEIEAESNTFLINIFRGQEVKEELEEFLSTDPDKDSYEVQISDPDNDIGYTFYTDSYKLVSLKEEGNKFKLTYTFTQYDPLSEIDKISAKVDYIAIMTDIDLEEV